MFILFSPSALFPHSHIHCFIFSAPVNSLGRRCLQTTLPRFPYQLVGFHLLPKRGTSGDQRVKEERGGLSLPGSHAAVGRVSCNSWVPRLPFCWWSWLHISKSNPLIPSPPLVSWGLEMVTSSHYFWSLTISWERLFSHLNWILIPDGTPDDKRLLFFHSSTNIYWVYDNSVNSVVFIAVALGIYYGIN